MDEVIDWLMAGDPVIRWQTMRDLLDASESEWQAERDKCVETGWGKQFIDALLPDCTWPDGRWTSTIWTLLTVMDCGLPSDQSLLHRAAKQFLDKNLTPARSIDETWLLKRMDLCHLGFWLRVGAYFIGCDERFTHLVQTILKVRLADGGWNCRIRNYPKAKHSSFHTTFNILEGLRPAAQAGIISQTLFDEYEAKALEFMLEHQMYRSDKTSEIVDERFTHLTFPAGWHYNVLRGLDYMRVCPQIADDRLKDPIMLLESRRNPSGRWSLEKRIAGTTLFNMEKFGAESRWVTLKMLRILKCRAAATR